MLFLAPLPETLRARREHSLGGINPLPLPLTACSTAGFVFYSLAIDNYLLFWWVRRVQCSGGQGC